MNRRYAVVDLETTGGRALRDKITEIAIVLHDGEQVVDTYETLVNPECYIPPGITQITGITQEMVADAPKFYEVARHVVEMTEGAIFVAHNVRFDYSFLREEFRRLGYTFTRKQLCTVRLSRQAFPGLPSYSLGRLAAHFRIPIEQRHRAMGDAAATARILELILQREENGEAVRKMVNLGLREALLPKNLTIEKIHRLPETCGVYYFHNQRGDVVYVGKSINIKKRVADHFAKDHSKAAKMQRHVDDISYELTGSELVALLHESEEIKRLHPQINRAQRIRSFPYVIHHWTNQAGYLCFGAAQTNAKQRKGLQVIAEFPKLGHARGRLDRMMRQYELCSKLCGLQAGGGGPCFHYHLQQCAGACCAEEDPETYNERARQALERMTAIFEEDFFIIDEGRTPGEKAVILVEDGRYRGYGYFCPEDDTFSAGALRDAITHHYTGNAETTRIIQRYLAKKRTGVRVVPLVVS